MAKSLQEYVEWLGERDYIWPAPPKFEPAKATPFLKPLAGIRAVTWNIYGTLLRIADGNLLFETSQQLRLQVAMEKTIREFNMWNSMSRKPGAPWEYLLQQYRRELKDERFTGSQQKGDYPEVNSTNIWRVLMGRLDQKEYQYDESFFGDADELSEKVAYFFHANLQGIEASTNALQSLLQVSKLGITQGLLADAQPFTLIQLLRALKQQGTLPPLGDLFVPGCLTLSYQEQIRKPSKSLYTTCLERFESLGIGPGEVLHVSNQLRDDLAIAKQVGMRTALFAGDKISLQATSAEVSDPAMKPDRLMTNLSQIQQILAGA